MTKPRKKVTIRLRHKLFDEVRSTCPVPDCKTPSGVSILEIHHRDGDTENNAEENLLALCPTCHTRAEKHLITDTDLDLWKRMLVNRHHPRLGLETAADLIRPAKRPRAKKVTTFKAEGNIGPTFQAERMTFGARGPARPPVAPAPDSIAAHAAERSYIEYLEGEYIRCRNLEAKYDPRRKQHFLRLKNAFKKAVGCDPLSAPIENFGALWKKARTAVSRTVGAVKYQNGFRPHDWDEHQKRFAG